MYEMIDLRRNIYDAKKKGQLTRLDSTNHLFEDQSDLDKDIFRHLHTHVCVGVC